MAGKNTFVRSVAPGSVFESAQAVIGSSLTLSEGDTVCFDSSGHLLRAPTGESDGANFLGIMRVSIALGKLIRPYSTDVDASQAISDVPGPQYGNTNSMQLKPSDTLNPGDEVYLWVPGSTVTTRGVSASGTKQIGVYQGPGAVTGGPSASGLTEVECYIGHRYPGDTLSF